MTNDVTPVTEAGLAPERLAGQRWYHVGRPWADRPGLIYAGSEDPHAGTFVADTGDDMGVMPDDDPRASTAVVAAIADLIVHEHNARFAATPSPAPTDREDERLRQERADHTRTIEQRDIAEEWADRLAYAIGGQDIGEHSNLNNPWANALALLPTQASDSPEKT